MAQDLIQFIFYLRLKFTYYRYLYLKLFTLRMSKTLLQFCLMSSVTDKNPDYLILIPLHIIGLFSWQSLAFSLYPDVLKISLPSALIQDFISYYFPKMVIFLQPVHIFPSVHFHIIASVIILRFKICSCFSSALKPLMSSLHLDLVIARIFKLWVKKLTWLAFRFKHSLEMRSFFCFISGLQCMLIAK